jgi:hypothetical protein
MGIGESKSVFEIDTEIEARAHPGEAVRKKNFANQSRSPHQNQNIAEAPIWAVYPEVAFLQFLI